MLTCIALYLAGKHAAKLALRRNAIAELAKRAVSTVPSSASESLEVQQTPSQEEALPPEGRSHTCGKTVVSWPVLSAAPGTTGNTVSGDVIV